MGTRYELAVEMLKSTKPFSRPVSDLKYTSRRRESREEISLCGILAKNLGNEACGSEQCGRTQEDFNRCFEAINDSMQEYLDFYAASYSYKQCVRSKFYDWLIRIRETYEIEDDGLSVEDWDIKKEQDPAVALLKLFHRREGLSKEDIGNEMGILSRAVQKNLRRLDPELCENEEEKKNIEPFRIGGQPVKANICVSTEKIQSSEKSSRNYHHRRFTMLNTIHPLVLQENLTQAAVLLMALSDFCHKKGSAAAFSIAVDIWYQLSEYARNKIERFFTVDNRDFRDFLDEIKERTKMPDEGAQWFMTEREMLESYDFESPRFRLTMAAKVSQRRCDLSVMIDGQEEFLRNQEIRCDEDEFVAVGRDGKETRFKAEDVVCVKDFQ